MSQHTPGPWRYDADDLFTAEHEAIVRESVPDYQAPFPVVLVRSNGPGPARWFIADCGCHEFSEGNARLIAATPDLLAACEALVEAYAFAIEPFESEAIAQGRAAIAKARGVEVPHLAGQDVEVQFSGDSEDLAADVGTTKPAAWEGKIISGPDVSGEEG